MNHDDIPKSINDLPLAMRPEENNPKFRCELYDLCLEIAECATLEDDEQLISNENYKLIEEFIKKWDPKIKE